MMMKKIIGLMCVLLLFTAAGCNKDAVESKEKLNIRGQITKISLNDNSKITSILVEGKIEQDTEYDKASIFISDKTKIYKNNAKEVLKASALKEGMKVEAVFEGPVRESYPVQADAKMIRIIE
jgi:beta-N-acetylhexosaminidase